jgi:hypothetical protein
MVTADHGRMITKCSGSGDWLASQHGIAGSGRGGWNDRRQAHWPALADNKNAAFPEECGVLRCHIEGRPGRRWAP